MLRVSLVRRPPSQMILNPGCMDLWTIAWTNHQTKLKAWMNYRQNLWTIAGTNHQTRFRRYEDGVLRKRREVFKRSPWVMRFVRGLREVPRGLWEVSERFPRGFWEVCERSPRGSERFVRGLHDVCERSPRGSERFVRGLREVPRGL